MLPSYLELSFSLIAEITSHDDSVDEQQKYKNHMNLSLQKFQKSEDKWKRQCKNSRTRFVNEILQTNLIMLTL